MSSLLVDIGNSNLKWAINRKGRLAIGRSLQTGREIPDFDGIWKAIEPPGRVLVSNVRGDGMQQAVARWVQNYWPVSVEFIQSSDRGFGIENGYHEPGRLGADRWVAMIAARARFEEAVCIADCGTALTVDVVDADGRHRGGVICPGVRLMQEALICGTEKLSFEGVRPDAILGRNTGAGIASGTLNAAAGLIEKIFDEARQSIDARIKLVITGGDAGAVAARLQIESEHIPDLVLNGLAVIDRDKCASEEKW